VANSTKVFGVKIVVMYMKLSSGRLTDAALIDKFYLLSCIRRLNSLICGVSKTSSNFISGPMSAKVAINIKNKNGIHATLWNETLI
jgi:hypothetical protein